MHQPRHTPSRISRAIASCAVVVALTAGTCPVSASAVVRPQVPQPRAESSLSLPAENTNVLVQFKSSVSPAQMRALGTVQGYRVAHDVPQIGWTVLEPAGVDAAIVAARLKASGAASRVEFDSTARLALAPDDPYYSTLWGMENTGQESGTVDADIDAETAWGVSTGDSNIVVAIVDTGADLSHADLADNAWHNPGEVPDNGVDDDGNGYIDDYYGWDFANDDKTPWDDAEADKHGTHVAGTIGAVGDNAVGVAGVNWDVQIMSCKFISPMAGDVSDGARAIVYAVDNGASVINHSWSTTLFSGMLADAMDYSRRHGVINVCAAANSSNDLAYNPEWPASLEATSIVTVAATDRDDNLASFSNYNQQIVDIAAPGVEITSTIPVYSAALYVDTTWDVAYFGFPVESIEQVSTRNDMISGAMDRLTASTNPPILVVDDSYPTLAGETVGRRSSAYVNALVAGGYTDIDVYDIEAHGGARPSAATLAAHTVVWFTGRMGYVNYTRGSLDSTDRTLLGTFLTGGGDLLLAGGDIGTDLDYMGYATSWYASYLHASCPDYESWTPDVNGASGTSLDGLFGTIAYDDFDYYDWPSGSDDLLAADASATSLVDWSGYGSISGTSMASPHVTGSIALIMSAYPGSTPEEAWTRIRNSVDELGSLTAYVARGGRMNIGDAATEYPAPPTIVSPAKGDVLARTGVGQLSFTPHVDEVTGTTYEVQVGTPTDLVSNGGFELGSLSGFTTGGTVGWSATQAAGEVLTGSWGACSGNISDSQTSTLTRSVTVPTGGAWLTFDYWLDSEDGFDYAYVTVGGQRRWLVARDTDWSPARLWLNSGAQSIVWTYSKDADTSEGKDAFGLDNVRVSTYTWSPSVAVALGSSEATFTVPDKATENGAVRMRATLGAKQSEWITSAGLTYATDITPPSAPTGLIATAQAQGTATLSWTDPADADFATTRIVRKIGSASSGPTDGTIVYQGLAEAASDSGLANGATVYYAAYSCDYVGNWSVAATTSITATNAQPASVTGFSATRSGDDVSLAWTNPTDADLAGVKILARDGTPPASPTDASAEVVYNGSGISALDASVFVPGLDTTRYYAAYAYDDAGGYATAATDSIVVDTTPPSAPTSLTAEPDGNGGATVTWVDPADSDFDLTRLVRKIGSAPTGPTDGTNLYEGTDETFIDDGLTNGDLVYYAAFARDAAGNWSSAAVTSITAVDSAPDPVTGLTATRNGNDVDLEWTNPSSPDLVGVRVVARNGTPPVSATDPLATVVYNGTGSSATDTGVFSTTGVETTRYYAAYSYDADPTYASPSTDSIAIDTKAPTGTFQIAGGDAWTPVQSVSLDSAVAGATQMRIDPGSGTYGSWVTYAAKVTKTLAVSSGEATVRMQYRDAAGNTLSLSDDIIVDLGAPHDDRLAGTNRYSTALDISRSAFDDGDAKTVVLATGEDYADALGASALAGAYGGPVLLTRGDALPAGLLGTDGELVRLGAKNVVIVGGTAAVSAAVESQLDAAGYVTPRIFGPDRYATAAAVAAQTLKVRGTSPIAETVFIARGDEYADALSVAPIAYATRAPVLLVKPTGVPAATRAAITSGGFKQARVIGGTAAIPNTVAGALGVSYRRIDGADRYATAAAVAKWASGEDLATFGYVGVATGTGFADALGGGAAVGAKGGVVLLTKPTSVPSATKLAIDSHAEEIRTLWVFGGSAAISDSTMNALTGLLP